jgi:hypothetical protein
MWLSDFFFGELLIEKFKVHQISDGSLIQKRMQKNWKSTIGGERRRRSSIIIDIDGENKTLSQEMK